MTTILPDFIEKVALAGKGKGLPAQHPLKPEPVTVVGGPNADRRIAAAPVSVPPGFAPGSGR